MNEKICYIIAGPNGSGKTTFAKELIKFNKIKFVNADEIAFKIAGNEFYKARIKAGKLFFTEIENQIKHQKSFIVETTLSGKYLQKIIKTLKNENYRIELIYIFLENVEEAINRVYIRVQKGGHFIDSEDIKRRFYRSKKMFWNEYKKNVDKWTMFLNSKDEFLIVADGKGNEINIIDELNYHLFKVL